MRILSGDEMREMDRRTSEEFGVSTLLLMENAGRAVAQCVHEMLTGEEHATGVPGITWMQAEATGAPRDVVAPGLDVAVVCGAGNNGGDGFVAARYLANWGYRCSVLLTSPPSKFAGDALANYQALQKLGLPVVDVSDRDDLPGLQTADLVVDAILGTGIRGEVRGRARSAIEILNETPVPVVAVDIPSGINADTGHIEGAAVIADVTVTFAAPKLGHVLYPGAEFAGGVAVADIGIPRALMQKTGGAGIFLIMPETVEGLLPERDEDSHKGTYGHAGLLAGSPGLIGAAEMAARACAVAGAGLTTAACPAFVHPILAGKLTEIMTRPIGQPENRVFAAGHVDECLEAVQAWDAVGIGCGIGREPHTLEFVRALVGRLDRPFVIDADGLNALGDQAAEVLAGNAELAVLTPHPGEMGRLLGTDTGWVQSNRVEAACRAADDLGAVCVLKGVHTLVAAPGGPVYVNLTGNAGLAKGGSGDVLTGIILSLLAQGLEPIEAACAGVWIHGKAAEVALRTSARASLLASDCISAVPEVYRLLGRD